jgi:hypothetical protein
MMKTEGLPDRNCNVLSSVRKKSLLMVFFVLALLLAYSVLFRPVPPVQNSLIKSLDESALVDGLRWYSENSVGSLGLPASEVCTVYPDDYFSACELFSKDSDITEIQKMLDKVLSQKENWPYIWRSGDSSDGGSVSFSLFEVTPLEIHALKKISSTPGERIETLVSFRRRVFSPVVHKLLEQSSSFLNEYVLTRLEELREQEYQHVVLLLHHPMGYHLEVPPLP